jgi:two-component system, LuxR family, response regulator FixJ
METVRPGRTVYVVDDDRTIIRILEAVISTMGLNVESYESAEEFLEAYKPTGPGCLLLDIDLPGMSGLELQAELTDNAIALPIIFITARGNERIESDARKAGALAFLDKPLRRQELCSEIQKAIHLDEEKWQQRESEDVF